MCGITGIVEKNFEASQLHKMTDAIAHRGPDANGYFISDDNQVGLGHRRLSILDLSVHGNQPFYSRNKRYVMAYNGEVYNFKVIARKLGIEVTTATDTEVILEGYLKKGVKIFDDLNGMFALAIYDTQEKYLVIARDRLGIKPLYIDQSKNGIRLASEIKALTALKKYEIDKDNIAQFLYLGYMPEGTSMFKNITKFPAGHYGVYQNNNLIIEPFWKAEDKINEAPTSYKSEAAAKKRLNELLTSAVSDRMISDVPLGTFLSGGTDSSTVTAIAQSVSDKPVKTFSIGFKESKFNEAEYAKKVAHHLKTEHYEFMLSEKQAIESFDHILKVYDEPFADSSSIPTMLVSEMAKKHVTVALSGDGGDELFLGYGMYNWAKRLNKPSVKALHKPLALALNALGNNRMKRAATVFNWSNKKRIKSHIFSQEQYYFSENEIKELLTNHISSDQKIKEHFSLERSLNVKEEQAFFDLNNYLKDDLLIKVDRASMLHSLEVRVPILDHRIVEFALNLPMSYKIKNGTDKYLLKEVLYDYVPKSLFDRPKWGFGIPLINWLKNDLKYLIDHYLNETIVNECGIVKLNVVSNLKSRFFAGEDYLYNRIWLLVLLHKWYKQQQNINV